MARKRKGTRVQQVRRVAKSRRVDVTRGEFNHVVDLLNQRGLIMNEVALQVEKNARNLELQFTRLAQIQADLDLITRTLAKRSLM